MEKIRKHHERNNMPIIEKNNRKILFIHIPKTGGTSVETYLFGGTLPEMTADAEQRKIIMWGNGIISASPPLQHFSASQIIKEIGYDSYRDLFKFAIVRNPYKRVLSAYIHRSTKKLYKQYGFTRRNIEEFRREIKTVLPMIISEQHAKYNNHFKTQKWFLEDEDGRIRTDIAILRTEDLKKGMIDSGFSDFDDRKCNTKRYTSYSYDEILKDIEIKNIIRNYYKEDFISFGYDM
ncbi:sulfotransferase family protein [Tetraselmis virus 1]|uniref:Sulfotransferase family protein n=1 Tax=Tetraselmis virus 1 TaxID=2060617 RepID=A0A2P0VPB0_9VIRU|nr:sulfotransferase family protein [Tetraselmis virus 1]AUF82727.1 sulfotransferase family protein [Tetraselmis virus 1]